MNEILVFLVENAIEIVFSLIGLAITVFAVPWLQNTVIPWLKDKRLYDIVQKFVKSAEKYAENHKIDKKAYVIELLKEKGIKITPIVEALIETAVKELDIAALTVKQSLLDTNGENTPTEEKQ